MPFVSSFQFTDHLILRQDEAIKVKLSLRMVSGVFHEYLMA